MMRRRNFIQGAITTIAALSAKAQEVPNSVGTGHPKLKAPAHASDCHIHIYSPERFPFAPNSKSAPAHASVAQYRMLQKRNGTTRVVIVTPRPYVVDNRATVDAIAQFGAENARGVAVVRPTVTDAELKQLNDGGIRGIRFSLGADFAVTTPDMIEPLAKRVAPLGWHLQFHAVLCSNPYGALIQQNHNLRKAQDPRHCWHSRSRHSQARQCPAPGPAGWWPAGPRSWPARDRRPRRRSPGPSWR